MDSLKDVRLEDKEWEDAAAWDARAKQRCAELGMTVVDPARSVRRDAYIDQYFQMRRRRGVMRSTAAERVRRPAAFGAMMLLSGLPIGTWLSELEVAAPTAALQPAVDEALPVVRASEAALLRARALHADGQLHHAMRALERIDVGDPARPDADRLRADIQRDLFAVAGVPIAVTPERGARP